VTSEPTRDGSASGTGRGCPPGLDGLIFAAKPQPPREQGASFNGNLRCPQAVGGRIAVTGAMKRLAGDVRAGRDGSASGTGRGCAPGLDDLIFVAVE
jgi:hypothetical protein